MGGRLINRDRGIVFILGLAEHRATPFDSGKAAASSLTNILATLEPQSASTVVSIVAVGDVHARPAGEIHSSRARQPSVGLKMASGAGVRLHGYGRDRPARRS